MTRHWEGEPDQDEEQQKAVGRVPRRARLEAPAGTEPEPHDPPTQPRGDSENDERLRADRPPHWG